MIKKVFGLLFMTVAIAASIPLGVNHSLSELREEAAGDYYYDQAGYAIYDGIEKREEAAKNLLTLAERYQEANPSLDKFIDELRYRVTASENAYDDDDTFAKEVEANQALDPAARDLAEALEAVNLTEKDQKYPRQMLAQMESEQDKIQRSSYNDGARAYNEKLKRMRFLAWQKPMAVFEPLDRTVEAATEEAVQAQEGGTAEQATDELTSRAEEWADNVASGAEEFADSVAEGVDELVDGILDGILG